VAILVNQFREWIWLAINEEIDAVERPAPNLGNYRPKSFRNNRLAITPVTAIPNIHLQLMKWFDEDARRAVVDNQPEVLELQMILFSAIPSALATVFCFRHFRNEFSAVVVGSYGSKELRPLHFRTTMPKSAYGKT
jgi:hypothetical protein